MKLAKLRLKNFGLFEDFELVFNDDDIMHLVGINGSGKTTIGLNSLWAGFKGIAAKSSTGALIGERFRFIAKGKKSLDIEITLHDEKTGYDIQFTRHITKGTNTIKIKQLDCDVQPTKDYIENLFNVSFLSAVHFTALSGKQQAEVMGIDTAKYDAKLILRKDEAAEIRKGIKKIGELEEVEECEKVGIVELQQKQKDAIAYNDVQKNIAQMKIDYNVKWDDLMERLVEAQKAFDDHEGTYQNMLTEKVTIDLEPIEKEIRDITNSNEKASAYKTYVEKVEEKKDLEEQLEDNKTKQADIEEARSIYLQGKTFGIKGLKIDEKGQLTKNGKYIRTPYFSKGELEMLVARISVSLNPELKVRFIDDFEMLDDANQEKLIKNLTKRGFQIITASVRPRKKSENSVILRECKVVSGGTNTKSNPIDKVVDEFEGTIASIGEDEDQLISDEDNI